MANYSSNKFFDQMPSNRVAFAFEEFYGKIETQITKRNRRNPNVREKNMATNRGAFEKEVYSCTYFALFKCFSDLFRLPY